MTTMLFHTLRGGCLVAALASAGLWVRSYFAIDQYTWPVRGDSPGFEMIDSRTVQTSPGRLIFQDRTALM